MQPSILLLSQGPLFLSTWVLQGLVDPFWPAKCEFCLLDQIEIESDNRPWHNRFPIIHGFAFLLPFSILFTLEKVRYCAVLWKHLSSLLKHCRKGIDGLPCTISNSNTQGKITWEATASRLLNETSHKTYSEPSNCAETKFMALKLGEVTNIPHFMTLSRSRFIIKQYAYNYSKLCFWDRYWIYRFVYRKWPQNSICLCHQRRNVVVPFSHDML